MISLVVAYALIVVSALILIRMLAASSRSAVPIFAAVVGLGGGLALLSPARHVGDSREHVMMARAIGHALPPRSADDTRLQPSWFYAFVAAPLVRGTELFSREGWMGFTALNLTLLAGAAALLARRVSTVAAILLAGGPILWWVDKPHPEVFTFTLIVAAVVWLDKSPAWSFIALGLASAQEPAVAVVLAAALIFASLPTGFANRRVWLAAGVSVVLAALNPLYQLGRHGSGALSAFGLDLHLPLTRELLSTPFDPNIGIFVHAPLVTAAIVVALVLALIRSTSQVVTLKHAAVLVFGALLIVAFSQRSNLNSGGTPGPSRYGLWLLPLAIPVLEAAPPALILRVLAGASLIWCTILFAPARPENYLQPTRLASALWQRWPAADNPLVEIFSERVSGAEIAPQPPLATPGCEKVLIIGRGSGSPTGWPGRCDAEVAPPFCREVDVLCYANRTSGGYAFTRLPLPWTRKPEDALPPRGKVDPLAVAVPETQTAFDLVGLGPGWSYLEELPDRDIRWRWMSDQAELGIVTRDAIGVRLRVDTRSHGAPRRLRISMPLGDIATWIVTPTRATFETGTFQLPAGPTILRFDSLDGADQADSDDPRRLSVAVFGIRVFSPQD